jgi:hypothetical protein
MMRTIEQILGIPPMNSQDMTAEPMYDAFTDKPDFRPYSVLPNQVPLDETNPTPATSGSTPATAAKAGAPQAAAAAWADWSARQDWSGEDRVNMAQGNRDVWYASNGFTKPYPGDGQVLLPDQVPGAGPVPPVVTTS